MNKLTLIVATMVLVLMFILTGCANNSPDTPIKPSGAESGYPGTSYAYFTSAVDADDDEIIYIFDWGDDSTSETGFVSSGTTVSESHSWSDPDTYFIRAKAIDGNGNSSDWSDFKKVIIAVRTYTLSTDVSPSGAGSITPSRGTYETGTTVSLTAQPNSGYVFDHWGGDATGSSTSLDITMNSDKHVIAYFTIPPKVEPSLEWSKTFGGESRDVGRSVLQTADGGYIICGYTNSYGAGFSNVYLIKTDSNGNKIWEQTFGGAQMDSGFSVQQTADGGFIIIGDTRSYGVGGSDVWLIKTDSSGNKQWDKTFGTGLSEWGWSVQQTTDGGYIISGTVVAFAEADVWLIKTDANGNQLWYKTFRGKSHKAVSSVQQTSDGGYIIVSDKWSYKIDVDIWHFDIWLIKTDANGRKMWERTFGGEGYDYPHSVQQTAEGGYIIIGETKSYGAGDADVWLIKTDLAGYQIWEQTFGGIQMDSGLAVQQTAEGGYIIIGETKSYGAGDADVWLIKTDSNGNKVWEHIFGGAQMDSGFSVQQTADGGYIITGETESYGAGEADIWLLKISAGSLD